MYQREARPLTEIVEKIDLSVLSCSYPRLCVQPASSLNLPSRGVIGLARTKVGYGLHAERGLLVLESNRKQSSPM